MPRSPRISDYQRWVLIALVLFVLMIVARAYRRIVETGWLASAGLALVVGGAVGNLMDRVISARGVVDFIDIGFGASRFFVFNVADAGVSVGAALLAYAFWQNQGGAAGLPTGAE